MHRGALLRGKQMVNIVCEIQLVSTVWEIQMVSTVCELQMANTVWEIQMVNTVCEIQMVNVDSVGIVCIACTVWWFTIYVHTYVHTHVRIVCIAW